MNTNASLGMGSCVWRETRRSIVAPLRLSLARPAPAPSIAAFESHRSAGASRLAPLGLVSDTVCPPQLKGCCSTARRWTTKMLNHSYRGLRAARLALASLMLTASCGAFGEDLLTFTNPEFGFTFQYPASWAVHSPGSPNSRAKVVSPKDRSHAECAVIVQRYPQLSSLPQGEIDQVFAQRPSPSEFKEALSQSHSDVTVLAVSVGALHSRPAHFARVRYSLGTEAGKMFASGRVLSTATPGLTWTVTCGAQGRSFDEAEKNYQYWQAVINNIVVSFQFR